MNESAAYTEDRWEELIGGRIVAMSPRPSIHHHFISANIYTIFDRYLRGKKCTPFGDGVDLFLSEDEQYIPDGMIVCDPGKIEANGVHGAPDLVVEVLSPSSVGADRGHKKNVYERFGVREYWIVSPSEKTVEQYLLQDGAFVMHQTYAVYPDWMLEKMKPEARAALVTSFKCSLFEDLTIRLEDVFARVQ